MFKQWIGMKKSEIKAKYFIYSTFTSIVENNKDTLSFLQRLYETLKDVPVDELRREFISKISELVHEENSKRH